MRCAVTLNENETETFADESKRPPNALFRQSVGSSHHVPRAAGVWRIFPASCLREHCNLVAAKSRRKIPTFSACAHQTTEKQLEDVVLTVDRAVWDS